MNCFVKEKFLLDKYKFRKEACDLGTVKIINDNLRSVHDISIGTLARYIVANLETKDNIDELQLQFHSWHEQVTLYLHLPHGFIILRDLKCLQPQAILKTRSTAAIRRIALYIAKV